MVGGLMLPMEELLISVVVFALIRFIPGDPALLMLDACDGKNLSQDVAGRPSSKSQSMPASMGIAL